VENIRENGVRMIEWPSKDGELYLVGGAKYDVAGLVVQFFGDSVGQGEEEEHQSDKDRWRGTVCTQEP